MKHIQESIIGRRTPNLSSFKDLQYGDVVEIYNDGKVSMRIYMPLKNLKHHYQDFDVFVTWDNAARIIRYWCADEFEQRFPNHVRFDDVKIIRYVTHINEWQSISDGTTLKKLFNKYHIPIRNINESIIGRKGSFENPCYKYAHMFKGDINGFFSYLGFLRDTGDNTEYAAYDAFFYSTGVKYNLRAVLLYDLEQWIYTYLDELEQQAVDMGIPRHNSRQFAMERLMGDIEDDDEFFERCNILKKYIKNKSTRYNLLRNFRIYLHLS